MADYDRDVAQAKARITKLLCVPTGAVDGIRLAEAFDELNKAWDALTDCLVRQRTVRDTQIQSLMNQLAERSK